MKHSRKIGIVGLWHLGEVYAAGLAGLGHTVIGYDPDPRVIENLNKGILPIAEPHIDELIKKNVADGRLSFTNAVAQLKGIDIIWITFDTPVDENDEPDTKIIFDILKTCAPQLRKGTMIIVTSQVPVGTSYELATLIETLRPDAHFDIAYVPENLQLGQAHKSFFEPSRIVIGTETKEAAEK